MSALLPRLVSLQDGTELRHAEEAGWNHAVLIEGDFACFGSKRALPEED